MEPGKRYHLAAEFDAELTMPATNANFWKPDVWKQEKFACQLEPTKN